MPEIAIITTVYNSEKYIADTINSVVNQTQKDWLFIIIDDGSQDGSRKIIKKYQEQEERILFVTQMNTGAARARNVGLSYVPRGTKFIMFLDHDDLLYPDTLQRLKEKLDEDEMFSAAYGLTRQIDRVGEPIFTSTEMAYGYKRVAIRNGRKHPLTAQNSPSTFDTFLYWDNIQTPGQVLIRYSRLLLNGGFDMMCEPLEDWDLWLKLALIGPFGYIPDFVIDYRVHPESISHNDYKNRRANLLVRQKLAMNSKLTQKQFHAARYGHLYSALDTFHWAFHSLKDGKVLRAGKQVLQGIRNYWLYFKTWRLTFGF